MNMDQIHEMAWEWMIKASDELRDIAKAANKASKEALMLKDKLEMRAVEKQAREGSLAVLKIFGKVVSASEPYSYDRTAG